MSNVAIKADRLGKLYRLGRAERYKTLRESLTSAVKSPFRWLSSRDRQADFAADQFLWALRDVSFEIQQGEAVGIIGRNGAGKSTLLKVLSRIVAPTEGAVELDGRVGSMLEVGTGFHPELTGRENIYLNGAILGMRRVEITRKFDEIVAFSEVEKFLDTPVKRYSSGMYTRLAFAVAAHLDPEILIVDEVLAVGDAEFQKKCLGRMDRAASNEGRTVLFVSHQMGSIAQLCTRAILMDKGRVVLQGETHHVIDQYMSQSAADSEAGYRSDPAADKDVFVAEAYGLNAAGQRSAEFAHDDPIRLMLTCKVNRWVPDAQIGISVRDSLGRIVFRSEAVVPDAARDGELTMSLTVPAHTLLPGRFIITLFIHRPFVRILDLADDALALTVTDAGSVFAQYEGKVDCGCVFVDCKWEVAASPSSADRDAALRTTSEVPA